MDPCVNTVIINDHLFFMIKLVGIISNGSSYSHFLSQFGKDTQRKKVESMRSHVARDRCLCGRAQKIASRPRAHGVAQINGDGVILGNNSQLEIGLNYFPNSIANNIVSMGLFCVGEAENEQIVPGNTYLANTHKYFKIT